MIALLGDIHGNAARLAWAIKQAEDQGAVALVQLGDFGMFTKSEAMFRSICKDAKIPVYFIDGNHDDCSRWVRHHDVWQIWEDVNLFYVPRGTVMELDNRMVAFMGGAASIDKHTRLRYHWHWDEEENISPQEVLRLMENVKDKKIDMFLTHCPPNSVINDHFDPRGKLQFGVAIDWHDHNQDIIENAWRSMGFPNIYSGHMHRRVEGLTYRILDIDELIFV